MSSPPLSEPVSLPVMSTDLPNTTGFGCAAIESWCGLGGAAHAAATGMAVTAAADAATASVLGLMSLPTRGTRMGWEDDCANLVLALERQGSGGPSGLQNRQGGAAPRLDGSIPSALRCAETLVVARHIATDGTPA